MRSASLALAFLLFALPSRGQTWGQTWTEPGEALPSALGGAYRHAAAIGLHNYVDYGGGDSELALSYKFYLQTAVLDDDKPYRLQPYFQRSSYVGGSISSGVEASSLVAFEGRYFLEEVGLELDAQLGGGASPAGGDHKQWVAGVGGLYHFPGARNIALELDLSGDGKRTEKGDPKDPDIVDTTTTTFDLGVRYVTTLSNLAMLEIVGGYRHSESRAKEEAKADQVNVSEGIIVDARYYFSKQLFAGIGFTMDPDRFSISGGYSTMSNSYIELEIGKDEDPDVGGLYSRLAIGLRF